MKWTDRLKLIHGKETVGGWGREQHIDHLEPKKKKKIYDRVHVILDAEELSLLVLLPVSAAPTGV